MGGGLFIPIFGTWALSLTCYVLAGVLMWRRLIHRNVHILLTVAGFLADIVALAMQKIHMMQVGQSMLDIPPGLRTAQGVSLDLSMGLYCVVALLGFSRIVGWHRLGRWHVPVALLFMANWFVARLLTFHVLS
jgi:hypothetical protein